MHIARIDQDIEGGIQSGVTVTPTLFVNGIQYTDLWDAEQLITAIVTASIEQLKVIGPLTGPTAYEGRPEDAFDLVIPSIPGYGFSGKPTGTGWNPDRIAQAWVELMQRLGYTRYVAQGGDWGSPITSAMARQAPAGLLGIHLNLPATIPPDVVPVLTSSGPAPAELSEKERAAFDSLDLFNKKDRAYALMMGTRPQTIGYGLTDSRRGCSDIQVSPSGQAAAILKSPRRKTRYWTTSRGNSPACRTLR